MYERFTDRARKVMQLANQAGAAVQPRVHRHRAHPARAGEGRLRRRGQRAQEPGRRPPQDPAGGREDRPAGPTATGRAHGPPAADPAGQEGRSSTRSRRPGNLNHNYVGTEHLLLGLLREAEGVGAQVLMNLGLKLDDVRQEVLNLLGHNADARRAGCRAPPDRQGPDAGPGAAGRSRYRSRARMVMQLANQEAQRFNHEYVGTEHILLGLIRTGRTPRSPPSSARHRPPGGAAGGGADRPAGGRRRSGGHGPPAADPAGQEGDRVRHRGSRRPG